MALLGSKAMGFHWLDPVTASIQWASAAGAAVYLSMNRNLGWIYAVSFFLVAELSAFYVTIPLAMYLGWSMQSYIFVAFLIGALGYLVWGSVFKLAQQLHDDPQGTVIAALRLWRGRGDPNNGGKP